MSRFPYCPRIRCVRRLRAELTKQRLSAASAALDLAPLSQTPPRTYRQRPFETSLKTSEWPQLGTHGGPFGTVSVLGGQQPHVDDAHESFLGSRKGSPVGMADSIASLPAIPSKSVPGTPFGFGGGMNGARRSGMSPNIAEGLTHAQRGFSNPDLARTFGQVGGGFSMTEPSRVGSLHISEVTTDECKAYGADPIYNSMFGPVTAPLPPSAAVAAAFTPQASAYDPYDLDDDGYGSGALYHDGPMGLKNKRAEVDRECESVIS